jgi:TRAP-type C4-dicarboxylate transport system permease small subunit
LQKLSDGIYKVSVYLIILLVAVMVVVTFMEVVGRNVLGQSLSWSDELARYAFIWLTFIGASAVYKRNELVGFDLLMGKFPERVRFILTILLQIIIIGFILVIIYFGYKQTFSRTVMIQHSAGLNLPMYIPYLSIPIGMFMMLIHAIAFLIAPDTKPKEGELL